MHRRCFLAVMTATPFAGWVHAQPRLRRVAVVAIGDLARPPLSSLVEGLRELGHVDGKNMEIMRPIPGNAPGGLARLAATAVERKADVIVAWGATAIHAAMKATKTIPVVMLTGSDPVQLGLVKNLARPEGNVTGLAFAAQLLIEKRMELLREVVPAMRRLGVLADPSSGGLPIGLKHLSQAAARLGIAVHRVDFADPTGVNETAAALSAEKVDALLVMPSSRFYGYRNEVVQIAAILRLPAMYTDAEYVRAGGLLAYSTDINAQFRRAAYFVDRMLKGAKPAELPIEQPTKYELALNLRTAKTLGLAVPQSVLVRADEVIQ